MRGLFAPWRRAYLSAGGAAGGECFLCHAGSAPDDPENLVVDADERFVVLLNRFPYAGGHVMVAPRRHVGRPEEMPAEQRAAFWPKVLEAKRVLELVYDPDGFNLGVNLGSAAGAGVIDHFHFHVIPRWQGDTNFMTSVAETRVLPEALGESWERIRSVYREGRHE